MIVMNAEYFASLYARYVIACIQAGASPVSIDAFREFLRVALAPSRGASG
jgi:hypothetical protein